MKDRKASLRIFLLAVIAPLVLMQAGCNTSLPEYLRPAPSWRKKPADHDATAGATLGPWRDCYDVKHYSLAVEPDLQNHTLKGECTLTLDLLEKSDTLQVDLHNSLEVLEVTQNKNNIKFRRKENKILIPSAHLEPQQTHRFTITYAGKPVASVKPPWVGGFVWERDPDGFPHVGVTCEGLGSSFWWPCKDHPTDEPDSMDIRITAPGGLMAISNGRLKSTEILNANQTRWHWQVRNPISTEGVTLQIGNFALLRDTMHTQGSVQELSYYVHPRDYEKARKHFAQAKKILRIFENLFGPYPWWDDGYKLIEAPYVGMEHQSAIAYGNGFSNENNYFTFGSVDYIILHETAHEWWGNSITACDPAEVWLHESFATYSEGLFIEQTLGYPKLVEYLIRQRKQARNKTPLVGRRNTHWWDWRNEDIYGKGSCVLHTLRKTIGENKFMHLLKEFSLRHGKSVVCTEDFITLTQEITGTDLSYFFEQYLYKSTLPELEYYFDGKRVYFRWTEVSGNFRMPVEFKAGMNKIKVSPTVLVDSREVEGASQVIPNTDEFLVTAKWNPAIKQLDNLYGTR